MRAPQDRREAHRQRKRNQRAERQRARAALAAGDERYLPKRDQGPVRRLARDYVDSRRRISEFFLFLALGVMALSLVPVAAVQFAVYNAVFPLLLVTVAVEAGLAARRVKQLAAERYPNHSTRGLAFYVITRGLQLRRLRLPGPRVKVGDRI